MPEPVDTVEMQAALLRLRRTSGLPVTFGGLLGLAPRQDRGTQRGADHRAARARHIGRQRARRQVDRPVAAVRGDRLPVVAAHQPRVRHRVAAEGLRSVVAVPVVVRRRVRGVLYGALREPLTLGDRTFDAAVAAARDVEQALVVRDEVQQLLSVTRDQVTDPGPLRGPGRTSARRTANCARSLPRWPTRCCARSCSRCARGWPRRPGRRMHTPVRCCWRRARSMSSPVWRRARPTLWRRPAGPSAGDGEGVSALGDAEAGGAHPAGSGGRRAPGGAAAVDRPAHGGAPMRRSVLVACLTSAVASAVPSGPRG